ncbi:MAG: glucose-1-phosphate adenylyltransferase, partial [Elusimicrobia bacterium]|nr:glucose-1-phosphate adenylyltransferase [Elusimicrobiota bacterium]
VYRMDVGQMIHRHVETGADATISTIPIPLKEVPSFGIVQTDAKGRISAFIEKPPTAEPMPGSSTHALASMGNYVFTKDVLVDLLKNRHKDEAELDFGKNVLPAMLKTHKLYAYDFSTNVLPGLKAYEEQAYWRDVGTIKSFYDSNMDILGARPRLNLNNRRWFVHSGRFEGPPAKILDGRITNSIISDGCFVRNATIKNSILGRGVHVHDGAVIEDSIIMDFCKVRADARIRRAIVDRFNEIPAKLSVGFDKDEDAKRYFVDSTGIVIVPRGQTVPR